ncbi:MAG: hypothetical protein QXY78_02825, partial [Thermoplasmata archaeon]
IRPKIQGYLDGIDGQYVYGWAWDPENPEKRLEVVVYVDGEPVAEGVADLYREDLERAGIGDGRYGFKLGLCKSFIEKNQGKMKEFQLKVCQDIVSVNYFSISSPIMGNIDGVNGLYAFGWVWNYNNPEKRLEVQIVDDEGNILGEGIADHYREDLIKAGIGDGKYGFLIKLKNIIWGKEYKLYIKVKGTDYILSNSYSFCPLPDFGGNVDTIKDLTVYGWAINWQDPENKVDVNIFIDYKLIATAKADSFRIDLKNKGIGDGFHAFQITLPEIPQFANEHLLEVFVGFGKYAKKIFSKKVTLSTNHENIDMFHVIDALYEKNIDLLILLKIYKDIEITTIQNLGKNLRNLHIPNALLVFCKDMELAKIINDYFVELKDKIFTFVFPEFMVEGIVLSKLKRLIDRIKYLMIIDIADFWILSKNFSDKLINLPNDVGIICSGIYPLNISQSEKVRDIKEFISTLYYRLANKKLTDINFKIPLGTILIRAEIIMHLIASYLTIEDIKNTENIYAYLYYLCNSGGFKIVNFYEFLIGGG